MRKPDPTTGGRTPGAAAGDGRRTGAETARRQAHLLHNAHLVTPDESISPGWLLVEGDRIEDLGGGPGPRRAPAGARTLNVEGGYVVPGLIDTHVCGLLGRDCRDGAEAVAAMARGLVRFGVTGFLPTIIGTFIDGIAVWLEGISALPASLDGAAKILGTHLEGPYLGARYRGLTLAEELDAPCIERDRVIYDRFPGLVKMVTMAPELPNSLAYIEYLAGRQAVAAIGHTEIASRDELDAAVAAGASHVTHIFNAMQVRTLKEPGVDAPGFADLALIDNRLTVSLIADGVHVCPEMIDLLLRAKGYGKVVLVTDCFMGTGMPAGIYTYPDGVEVVVDGACHRTRKEHLLAGSVLTLNRAVRNVMAWTDVPVTQAVAMATANPARLIGLAGRKGRLRPGMDADLAVFDREWTPQWTMVAGKVVFGQEPGICRHA